MKKLALMLMALICIVSFAGCGDQDSAREVVEDFMDAMVDLDLEEMMECISDPDEIPDDIRRMTEEYLLDQIPWEYREDFEEIVEAYTDKISDSMYYQILDMKQEHGSYIFKVRIAFPEVRGDTLSRIMESDEIEAIIEDLTREGLPQDKIIEVAMPKITEIAKKKINALVIDVETETEEIVVSRYGNTWLINADETF